MIFEDISGMISERYLKCDIWKRSEIRIHDISEDILDMICERDLSDIIPHVSLSDVVYMTYLKIS